MLYETMYNDDKYFFYTLKCISYYTRRCIITMYIFNIRDDV